MQFQLVSHIPETTLNFAQFPLTGLFCGMYELNVGQIQSTRPDMLVPPKTNQMLCFINGTHFWDSNEYKKVKIGNRKCYSNLHLQKVCNIYGLTLYEKLTRSDKSLKFTESTLQTELDLESRLGKWSESSFVEKRLKKKSPIGLLRSVVSFPLVDLN